MLDLDRTMFFKAKFDVAENSDGDALWSVIMCLKRWSLKKARYGDYRLPSEPHAWSELKHGDKIVADGADVRLFSCMHREGDVYTWACQHSEVSRIIGCAPREWTTEIGFEGRTRSSGTVSIITMYSDAPGFLGPLQETPSPTIPGLVRLLANDDQLTCTVDGCPLSLEPIEFKIDGCAALYETIANPAREVPVIVCAPSHGGRLSLDPETIVRQLGPNALVYFTRDCEAMNALNAISPQTTLDVSEERFAYTPHAPTSPILPTHIITATSPRRRFASMVPITTTRFSGGPSLRTCISGRPRFALTT